MTEETPKASITVEELDALVEQAFDLKEEASDYESKRKKANKKLATLKEKIHLALKELGRKDYKSPRGTVYEQEPKFTVTLPKDGVAKQEFFDWLKERELFDSFATVNYQSLQSLWQSEFKAAQERGEAMTFKIPGIEEAKVRQDIGMRKK